MYDKKFIWTFNSKLINHQKGCETLSDYFNAKVLEQSSDSRIKLILLYLYVTQTCIN